MKNNIIILIICSFVHVFGCASMSKKAGFDYITRQEYEYGLMQEQRKDEMLAELIKGSARSDSEIRVQMFERMRQLELKFEKYEQKVY